MTLQERWENYRQAVYPQGCSPVQEQETRQAFMAGALSMHQETMRAADLHDEHAAMKIVARLEAEVMGHLAAHLAKAEVEHKHPGRRGN